MRSVFKFRLELRIHKSGLDRRVAYQKLWWKRMQLYEERYEVYTRSVHMVCPGARHELLKRDCSTWAGTCCENNEQLKHEKKSQLLILSPNGTPARQTFWELNRRTFHHLLYLHLFSIHSHCFCSFTSGIVFLHFAFMFLLLVFMSFHFNCMSFYFDDPRSGMYNPMSVKRILNAKGTTFTWMFFLIREQLYFIPPVPSSTSACMHLNMHVLVAQALRKDQGHAFFLKSKSGS